jgi:hypothetical protein
MAEIIPPLQITTSASDDTNPDRIDEISSFSGPDREALMRSEKGATKMMNIEVSKVPSSTPSEVAKVSTCITELHNTSTLIPLSSETAMKSANKELVKDVSHNETNRTEALNSKCAFEVPVIPSHKIEISSSSSADEESTSSSNFLSSNGLQWTDKKTRVGQEFQATYLPEAGSYLNLQGDDFDQLEQLLLADQIWDPLKATCKGINDFVHLNCPSNKKEAALELLHQKDYDDSCFSAELQRLPVLDGSDWSLIEHENFRKLMQSSRHNVHSVSQSMGKSINNCLTVYYKIINVRETRSTKKRFSGIKPIDEINELKDIGRSMRIEKRNLRKRNSDASSEDCDANNSTASAKTICRKRRKAASASDKIKIKSPRPAVNSKASSSNTAEKIEKHQKTKIVKRTSPRTQKRIPNRLSDEQALESIYAAVVAKRNSAKKSQKRQVEASVATRKKTQVKASAVTRKKTQSEASPEQSSLVLRKQRNRQVVDENEGKERKHSIVMHSNSQTNTKKPRAAKEQALKSLSQNSTVVKKQVVITKRDRKCKAKRTDNHDSDTGKNTVDGTQRVTRKMQSKSNLLQNKRRQPQSTSLGNNYDLDCNEVTRGTRLAKKQALKSLRTSAGNDSDEDGDWDESKDRIRPNNSATEPSEHNSEQDLWDHRYAALIKFKNEKGHCLVPKVYPENRQLSYWVFRQRGLFSNRKKNKGVSSLTGTRIQKLKDIGFVFKAKHSQEQNKVDAARRKPQLDAKWNRFYEEFCSYRKKSGSCLIPKVFEENQPLSSW